MVNLSENAHFAIDAEEDILWQTMVTDTHVETVDSQFLKPTTKKRMNNFTQA